MKFEIKHRISGDILFSVKTESLRLAVGLAVKAGADLGGADLRGADLSGAYLRDAYLRDAYLSDADLRGANLRGADLRDAKGINKYLTSHLYLFLDQVGKIRAYKLTTTDDEGPTYGGIEYTIGKTIEAKADDNESTQCSYGISVATLDWCMSNWQPGYKIKVVEFSRNDIAAIPIASDGKFRVSKCKVIREKNLKELGLE